MANRQKAWRLPIPPGARAIVDGAVELALMDPPPGMPAVAALNAVRRAFELDIPATLPTLAPLMFAGDWTVAAAAEEGTERLLDSMQSWEFAALDRELRAPYGPLSRVVDLASLPALVRRSTRQGLLIGIASCHREGRVRAAALHTAEQWDVEPGLLFTLLRLDDWVLPVRRLARARILERLTIAHVPELIPALPLMEALARRRRVKQDKALGWVEHLLRDDDAREALWAGLASPETAVRRSCLGLLAESPDVDLVRMLDVATQPGDPVLAGRAADAVLARIQGLPQTLLVSPSAAVRVRAVVRAASLPPTESLRPLQAALFDPRRTVREVAIHHLRAGGAERIEARYRAVVDEGEGQALQAAVAGLGETGGREDIPRLVQLLAPDVAPTLAATALAAIARLDPRGQGDLFVTHLDDPRRGVSREARTALLSSRSVAPEERIWELVVNASTDHGSRNAFRIVARGTRWRRVARMVAGARSTDPWIVQYALAGLERWCRGSARYGQVPIGARDAELVEAALKGRGRSVPGEIVTVVRATLALARA
jgi:hypothetical protein